MSVGWRREADLKEWDFQFYIVVDVSNPHVSQLTHDSNIMLWTVNRRTMFPGRLFSRSSRWKSTSNERASSCRTYFACAWGARLFWRCKASKTWSYLFCHTKHVHPVTTTRSLMFSIEVTMTRISTTLVELSAHTRSGRWKYLNCSDAFFKLCLRRWRRWYWHRGVFQVAEVAKFFWSGSRQDQLLQVCYLGSVVSMESQFGGNTQKEELWHNADDVVDVDEVGKVSYNWGKYTYFARGCYVRVARNWARRVRLDVTVGRRTSRTTRTRTITKTRTRRKLVTRETSRTTRATLVWREGSEWKIREDL